LRQQAASLYAFTIGECCRTKKGRCFALEGLIARREERILGWKEKEGSRCRGSCHIRERGEEKEAKRYGKHVGGREFANDF